MSIFDWASVIVLAVVVIGACYLSPTIEGGDNSQ
jgi:hypothetical protein